MKRVLALVLSVVFCLIFARQSSATECVDVEFVFARGSGGSYQQSDEYLAFKRNLTKMTDRISMASFRFTDVDYPAIAIDSPKIAIGAYVSAGKYYEFGRSVAAGVASLRNYYERTMAQCSTTRWVLAGYSQGAMVVAQAVRSFRAKHVIYVGLIGDPQLNLPEGSGLLPDACLGLNYSEYRVYAPVCRTRKGSLGARNPYQYGELVGKYGLWCARNDYICGSSMSLLNNSGHTQYVKLGSYAQLSYMVQQKMTTSRVELLRATYTEARAESEVYALLGQEEYFGRPNDEICLSAASSFSLGSDIVRYEWALEDGDYVADGVELCRKFPVGTHEVRLRVSDRNNVQAEAVARIVITEEIADNRLTPPVVLAERQGDAVYFSWHEKPLGAEYLLVRLNGMDLGYVRARDLAVGIHDLKIEDGDVLSVAWMDADMNVGNEHTVLISDVVEVETLSHEQELRPKDGDIEVERAPNTGVDNVLLDYAMLLVVVSFSIICIKNTRHLRDG